MKRIQSVLLFSYIFLVGIVPSLRSQDIVPATVNDQNRSGPLPFSGSIQGPADSVDLSGGGLSIKIPLIHVKGRGLDYTLALRYSSLFWSINDFTNGSNYYSSWGTRAGNWLPGHVVGWETNQPYLTWVYSKPYCLDGVQGIVKPTGGYPAGATTSTEKTGYIFTDEDGKVHNLQRDLTAGGCFGYADYGPDTTNEGYLPGPGAPLSIVNADGLAYASGGTAPTPITTTSGVIGYANGEDGLTDANGNSLTLTPGGVDTLGRTLSTVTQNGSSQILYAVYDANGNPQTITVNLTTVNFSTSFATQGGYGTTATEASGSFKAISSIVLPNNQQYSFTYEPGTYGGIASMTIPSGATIHYTWGTTGTNEYNTHRYVTSRSVTVNGVTSTYNLSVVASGTGPTVTTVTDPAGNQQTYSSMAGHIVSLKQYSGTASGTPLKEVDIAYTLWNPATGSPYDGALPSSVTTKLADSGNTLVSQTQYDYDQFSYSWTTCPSPPCSDPSMYDTETYTASRGNVVEKREYDWGTANSGTFGPLIRRTHDTFLHDANTNYLTYNIVNRLSSQIVYDGSGNTISQTQFGYDAVTPSALSGVPQHTTRPSNYRGNPTTVSRWRNTDGAWLTTTYTYDDTGNITAIADPLNHITHWSYSDVWATTSTGNCVPSAVTLAYPTVITDALNHQKKVTYQPCTGQQQSVRDPNDLANSRTGTVYTYDSMDRPLTTAYADGGLTSISYGDSVPNTVTTSVKINSSVNKTTVVEKDALGRDRKTSLTTDPDGITYTRISYDAMGRKYQEWNPTRCDPDTYSSCSGEPTFGYTAHDYDALSRETYTVPPDGTSTANRVVTSYTLNATNVTDQAGVGHTGTIDALGRLIQVSEVNMGWLTSYVYDAQGNLTCVEQHGGVSGTGCAAAVTSDASSPWRVRRFTYDSLSHLLAAKNPEAGTSTASCNGSSNPWSICYSYNNDGVLISKTDARGATINYSPTASPLDALHRVTEKTYSAGDATVTYAYDGGATSANGILKRTSMTDGSGSASWTYDSEGRELVESKKILTYTKTISTQYNLDGSVWKLTYPSGAVVEYTPGGAGRPLAVTDDTNTIYYAKSAAYAPHGELKSLLLGYTASFAGITETDQYNTRFQPSSLTAAAPSGTVLSLSYNFGLGTNDNGNVRGIVNNRDTTRNQTFTYDGVNRLTKAQGGTLWGATFTYDAWGNLYQTGSVTGTTTQAMTVSQQMNVANQFTLIGYSYDAAGNVATDGYHTSCGINNVSFLWNSEEQISCGSGLTYTYDGDGVRVNHNSTLYWGGGAGSALAEGNSFGGLTSEFVFLNGKRISRRDLSGGAVYYYFSDMLGSSNVVTNATGAIQNESDFYPFGAERAVTSNLTSQHYKFSGRERDTETGDDYFGARYLSSISGRWLSPDWSAKEEPVPYATFDDPQSLNLYSYVRNNPLSRTDPDGHCPWCIPVLAGAGVLGESAEVGGAAGALAGPPGVVIGVAVGALVGGGILAYEHFHEDAPAPAEQPRAPDGKFAPKTGAEAAPGANAEKGALEAEGATKTGTTLPGTTRKVDGTVTDTGQKIEVKSGESVSNTGQLVATGQAAKAATGQPLLVVTTNPNVKVSAPAQANKNLVIRPVKQPQQ